MTDQLDLSRRAVACKGWRWQSGMEEVRRGRVMDVVTHDGETLARALVRDRSSAYMNGSVNLMWTAVTSSWLPDLTDPATVGCLLALVREAWSDPMLFAFPDAFPDRWTVVYGDYGHHETEAAALVAALEVAP